MIKFDNAAEAAGLAAQVAAFDGDGAAMARNMLLGQDRPVVPHHPRQLGRSADGPVQPVHPAARSSPVAAGRRHGTPRPAPSRGRPAPSRPSRRRPARCIAGRHLRRRTSHEPVSSTIAAHRGQGRSWSSSCSAWSVTSASGNGRSAGSRSRRDTACWSATRAPGRSARCPQAPEGTLVQTDVAGPPAPGRHPRGHARPGTPFLLAAGVRDPARQGRGHPAGQDRRGGLQDRQAAARGDLPGRRQGISRHPPQGPDPGALSDQHLCLRCQDRGRRCLRRAQHAGRAQGRGPDADPAGLCRRGDQQGERSARPGRTAASRSRSSSPGSTSSIPRRSGSTSSASAIPRPA